MDRVKLTDVQSEALRWLSKRNGDGLFDRNGVLVAGGERAPYMRSTWNALCAAGLTELYGGSNGRRRLRVIVAALETFDGKA